jgi:hypothetical protein
MRGKQDLRLTLQTVGNKSVRIRIQGEGAHELSNSRRNHCKGELQEICSGKGQ